MADLRINGQSINGDSKILFGEFLNSLNKELAKNSQVVSIIRINGQSIDEIKESEYSMLSLEKIGKVDITTSDQLELAFEALMSAKLYIKKLTKHCKNTGNLYIAKDYKRADKDFVELVDGLDNLVNLILSAQSVLRGKSRGIHTNDSSLRIAQVRLLSAIEELLPAKKSNNHELLADVLCVELPEALQEMSDYGIPVMQRMRSS